MTSLAFTGCRVFDGERMLDGRAVILADGLVEAVVEDGRIPRHAEKFDLGGGILAPAAILFVAFQTHIGSSARRGCCQRSSPTGWRF
jgi:N-acetylglucosamine-6-phosphate deacetylase